MRGFVNFTKGHWPLISMSQVDTKARQAAVISRNQGFRAGRQVLGRRWQIAGSEAELGPSRLRWGVGVAASWWLVLGARGGH